MDLVEVLTRLLEIFYHHRGKIIGLLTGFLISILLLTLGLLKTFFIVGCSIIGFVIGKKVDNHEDFRDLIDRILPPHD
ncbi:hypothetical protein BBF96_09155 [Anoxybacter fermentans]|uniref:DUF2273 domain-containing protein n=1 Tax=Anoxybacter fermentans TaxID=1323375 RepID=A0A3S9SZ61_9FIRM|nr:DUF2273 domain-containing protein [Anoxybacter fermentans]AZR73538.1 hypothetical protein BBF96_09155 [Anoxybacter fermentans]